MTRRSLALAIAAVAVALDQITKAWAVAALDDRSIEVIDGFLGFVLARNSGAAFSSFQGGGQVIGVLAIGVAVVITVMIERVPTRWDVVALGIILGGAVGNLVDRIVRGDGILDGSVVDWIDLWVIPTFNVADSCITIGVALLFLGSFRRHPEGTTGGRD